MSSLEVIPNYLCSHCLQKQTLTLNSPLRECTKMASVSTCQRERHCDECFNIHGRCCFIYQWFS